MVQNARATAFTVSEIFKENKKGGGELHKAKAYKGFDPLPHLVGLSAPKILADCLTQ